MILSAWLPGGLALLRCLPAAWLLLSLAARASGWPACLAGCPAGARAWRRRLRALQIDPSGPPCRSCQIVACDASLRARPALISGLAHLDGKRLARHILFRRATFVPPVAVCPLVCLSAELPTYRALRPHYHAVPCLLLLYLLVVLLLVVLLLLLFFFFFLFFIFILLLSSSLPPGDALHASSRLLLRPLPVVDASLHDLSLSIIIYNIILYYSEVWYGMVWYAMLWYGMVWYGMVWHGMVWYGMVWLV